MNHALAIAVALLALSGLPPLAHADHHGAHVGFDLTFQEPSPIAYCRGEVDARAPDADYECAATP